nr:hypothetical protein [Tanacetum cinerariifolium]
FDKAGNRLPDNKLGPSFMFLVFPDVTEDIAAKFKYKYIYREVQRGSRHLPESRQTVRFKYGAVGFGEDDVNGQQPTTDKATYVAQALKGKQVQQVQKQVIKQSRNLDDSARAVSKRAVLRPVKARVQSNADIEFDGKTVQLVTRSDFRPTTYRLGLTMITTNKDADGKIVVKKDYRYLLFDKNIAEFETLAEATDFMAYVYASVSINVNLLDKIKLQDPTNAANIIPVEAKHFVNNNVWLWNDFPSRKDFGGNDTGIDLVARTPAGDYWAIQCKCVQEGTIVDKPAIDSFIATSSRSFRNDQLQTVHFVQRLWISTTNKWGPNAEEAIKNQNPPFSRLDLNWLNQAAVDWEKLENGISGEQARAGAPFELRQHQQDALTKTHEAFKTESRGKLIMACGTGKTFTALRIAEHETHSKGLVLFMVPSIALLGQTLREWSNNAQEDMASICICSDAEITRQRQKQGDSDSFSVVDLALPASTSVPSIVKQFTALAAAPPNGMTVVFSTYQSINVIAEAQQALQKSLPQFGEFDLIICDEAHRTTGVSVAGADESNFTRVHNNDFLRAKKRLYMTATPRLYNDETKSKAAQNEALLCSMDDEKLYGPEIYRIGFGEAVEKGLLTDYKVLILTLSDQDVPPAIQKMIAGEDNEIDADDASRLIGCVNALSKQVLGDEGIIKETDPEPMRRAVAFCSNISASKKITGTFNSATDTYIDALPEQKRESMVSVQAQHIDGGMNAPRRDELLAWLKAETPERECRILTNVRCLSEGVDVPSLDAVLFLSARNSQVDVVQSVGRVMRRAPGKKYGYIVIPIVVPSTIDAAQALDDNDRYRVVWTVLNALRAHDDRFNATVNKIELNKKRPAQILIVRITDLLATHPDLQKAFDKFLGGLRNNINPSITQQQAIEMLSQHIITRPVFEALFEGYSFVHNNPISVSMQQMLDLLEETNVAEETTLLQKFYESVKLRASGIDNAEGKQRIIIELYDKFFKTAFPKMVEQLGIVYTPVEVVDFILRSVDDRTSGELSRKEGGKIFGSGSRTPITITLLVKNPESATSSATVHYHDIGDYLTREAKLDIIKSFRSISNAKMPWQTLQPNEHGDWLAQRTDIFDTFIPFAPEKKFDPKAQSIFTTNVVGIATNRDAWVYNSSRKEVERNMRRMIDFYNEQRQAFKAAHSQDPKLAFDDFAIADAKEISWSRALRRDAEKNLPREFKPAQFRTVVYRPFSKQQYGKNVTKEDIFYYVYGLLHSPVYCETFATDLKKQLPRVPLLDDVREFWAFSKAGRQLAALHLD